MAIAPPAAPPGGRDALPTPAPTPDPAPTLSLESPAPAPAPGFPIPSPQFPQLNESGTSSITFDRIRTERVREKERKWGEKMGKVIDRANKAGRREGGT